MRRLVYALSLATVAFAVSTAYFARAYYLERARGESRIAPVASAEAPAKKSAPRLSSPGATAESAPVDRSAAAEAATRVESRSHGPTDPREFLEQFNDPARRAAMVDDKKELLRRSSPGLGDYLHMDDDELERFIDLVARQRIDTEEASLRCYVNKTCAPGSVDPGLLEAQRREITEQFGAQTPEAFEFYRDTSPVRLTVTELRASLPDKHRLLDAQSEALIEALHEESQRIKRDIRERHLQLMVTNDILFTSLTGTPRERESAQAAVVYNRMMLDRAASVLTPEQLAVYAKMQKDELEGRPRIHTIR